jgi:hypothetical protein
MSTKMHRILNHGKIRQALHRGMVREEELAAPEIKGLGLFMDSLKKPSEPEMEDL